MKFGLIGYPLGHSFSKAFFEKKFEQEGYPDFSYDLFPLDNIDQVDSILQSDVFGLNITIPYKSVTEQLGEFFVYVVGDSNKVSQRKIVIGKQLDTMVVIKDGLKEGEKVVVQGVQNLREGAVITTEPPAPAKK